MIEYISKPWPWYISGFLIACIMLILLWMGGKFGVSSTLRTWCALGGAGKRIKYFQYDWKRQIWNLVFITGSILGGFIATNFLSNDEPLHLSSRTIAQLANLGIDFDGELVPLGIFNWQNLLSTRGLLMIIVGGFLVGFGTRWAGGCTSGHAISGLSNFQLPSLIAVIGFFLGGLVMTHLLFPLIF